MQSAGRRISLAAEFPAGMKRGQNHFQCAQILELWMWINRDATPIVTHGEPVALLDRDLDKAGVAGHRLVHRIVENFRRKVMQRRFVGAADIHCRALANGLQPFQHLDIFGGVIRVVATRQG